MNLIYRYAVCGLALLGIISCKTQKLAAKPPVKNAANAPAATTNNATPDTTGKAATAPIEGKDVLSIILHATRQGEGIAWRVEKAMTANGFIKKGAQLHLPGYYTAYFTDASGHNVDSTFFEPPLDRHMEYPAEQDGKLETKAIHDQEGTAFLRTNYRHAISDVKLYDAKGNLMITLNIKEHIR